MFTGIVTDVGEIAKLTPTAQGQLHRMRIACVYDQTTIADGASIACNGGQKASTSFPHRWSAYAHSAPVRQGSHATMRQ